ncbi:MAG: terpene cyclase/mutase family protein [Planctomycetes bacterium]|nr:terpene cyclase/mutase family protein [Planctomycetota bacterium]MDA0948750.1 terpene cyclase/mutase family protein [Planctomycetota bacterium]
MLLTSLLACAAVALPPAQEPALREPRSPGAPLVEITEEQERAVERGLAWLATRQDATGGWSSDVGFKLNSGYRATALDRGHVGVSALAGMAFLAGGHVPGRGEYGAVIERCLDFVLGCVQEDGYVTNAGTRMYSHAFATLFLAEIYGMTHRQDVRSKLQAAVDFIVRSQNPEGGWRYVPLARESDMSIVVCQVLALRAARNIGIRVPRATIDRALDYVKASAVTRSSFGRGSSELGTFHYQVEENSFSRSSFPLTAAGVTAMHGLGIYSDDLILRGVEFLEAEEDLFNARYGQRGHYFFWYGHYYGVQAMYTVGGDRWQRYFTKLRERLLDIQRPDGTWPNEVGPGEEFSTAMACLILEIPYSFLPIFQR